MTSTSAAESWPSFRDSLPVDDLFNAIVDLDADPDITRLASLYDNDRPDLAKPLAAPSIPRVFHQIWLGGPLPRRLARYAATWRRYHPEWEFRLWTDSEVAKFDFETRAEFESTPSLGQKSDLLRAEILNRFGGVYVDLDYECYKPLDSLAARYDFFNTLKFQFTAYLGWPSVWRQPVLVCNSLIGSRPGHPILTNYLERVRAGWKDADKFELTEDELMPIAVWVIGGEEKAAQLKETGLRTFLPHGEAVADLAGRGEDRDIVLPPVFFNPVMAGARTLYMMPEFWVRCRAAGIRWPRLGAYLRPQALSFANHVSASRWL